MRFLPQFVLCIVALTGCSQSPSEKSESDISLGKEKSAESKEISATKQSDQNDFSKMTQVDPNLAKEATTDFDKAIKDDPKNPDAWYARGFDTLSHSDHMDPAIEDFNKAIELNPKYARAYLMRGRAYAAVGDMDKAKADRDKALELEPGID